MHAIKSKSRKNKKNKIKQTLDDIKTKAYSSLSRSDANGFLCGISIGEGMSLRL